MPLRGRPLLAATRLSSLIDHLAQSPLSARQSPRDALSLHGLDRKIFILGTGKGHVPRLFDFKEVLACSTSKEQIKWPECERATAATCEQFYKCAIFSLSCLINRGCALNGVMSCVLAFIKSSFFPCICHAMPCDPAGPACKSQATPFGEAAVNICRR